MKIRVGTRGSSLARAQSRWVISHLQKLDPSIELEEVVLKTKGDIDLKSPLHQHQTPGLFTTEIEKSLMNSEIDLAVHSHKDLPTSSTDGLVIVAIPIREVPWDAWVSEEFPSPVDLHPGARVATGSLRRRAQLLNQFSLLDVVGIRGNVDTRLDLYRERGDSALVIASAGLRRLGLHEKIRYEFGPTEITPSPGQGALAIQMRAGSEGIDLVSRLDDVSTRRAVTAERALLSSLGGGCHLPIGSYGREHGRGITLIGMVALPDGSRLLRLGTEGPAEEPEQLGEALADLLLQSGGDEIMEELEKDISR